jgi:hypothetical protein
MLAIIEEMSMDDLIREEEERYYFCLPDMCLGCLYDKYQWETVRAQQSKRCQRVPQYQGGSGREQEPIERGHIQQYPQHAGQYPQ